MTTTVTLHFYGQMHEGQEVGGTPPPILFQNALVSFEGAHVVVRHGEHNHLVAYPAHTVKHVQQLDVLKSPMLWETIEPEGEETE